MSSTNAVHHTTMPTDVRTLCIPVWQAPDATPWATAHHFVLELSPGACADHGTAVLCSGPCRDSSAATRERDHDSSRLTPPTR